MVSYRMLKRRKEVLGRFIMKLRMIVDTVMLVLFLAILDYRQIGSSHHEIFGMIFFVIVIFHNYLNRQWYKSLPRGRWNWDRRFTFLIDVVLIGSFLAVMITAPLISYKLSLDINAPLIVHKIHRIGGYVMLVAIGLHLGIHWSALLPRFKKALHLGNTKTISIFLKVLAVALAAAGIYFSFGFHMGNRIFLLPVTGTRMRAPNVPAFVLAHLTIAILYAEISYYIQKFIKSSGRRPRAVKK